MFTFLFHGVLRTGNAGNAGQAGEDDVPELMLQGLQRIGGDGGKPLLNGGVPGMDHAA